MTTDFIFDLKLLKHFSCVTMILLLGIFKIVSIFLEVHVIYLDKMIRNEKAEGQEEGITNEYKASSGDDENVLKLGYGDGCATL